MPAGPAAINLAYEGDAAKRRRPNTRRTYCGALCGVRRAILNYAHLTARRRFSIRQADASRRLAPAQYSVPILLVDRFTEPAEPSVIQLGGEQPT